MFRFWPECTISDSFEIREAHSIKTTIPTTFVKHTVQIPAGDFMKVNISIQIILETQNVVSGLHTAYCRQGSNLCSFTDDIMRKHVHKTLPVHFCIFSPLLFAQMTVNMYVCPWLCVGVCASEIRL